MIIVFHRRNVSLHHPLRSGNLHHTNRLLSGSRHHRIRLHRNHCCDCCRHYSLHYDKWKNCYCAMHRLCCYGWYLHYCVSYYCYFGLHWHCFGWYCCYCGLRWKCFLM